MSESRQRFARWRRETVLRLLIQVCLVWLAIYSTHLSPTLRAEWRIAEPGWSYSFPKDHWSHDGFKTEWWYFTGQLTDEGGRRFGYQVTFFRQGVRPPAQRVPVRSRFVIDH